MRLREQIAEPLNNFGLAGRSEVDDIVCDILEKVELPTSFLRRFPHELSGGQRQRVALAREELSTVQQLNTAKANVKTKKEVMANLDQWLTTIDSIKDVLKTEKIHLSSLPPRLE